jgi:hypothetical protein
MGARYLVPRDCYVREEATATREILNDGQDCVSCGPTQTPILL